MEKGPEEIPAGKHLFFFLMAMFEHIVPGAGQLDKPSDTKTSSVPVT